MKSIGYLNDPHRNNLCFENQSKADSKLNGSSVADLVLGKQQPPTQPSFTCLVLGHQFQFHWASYISIFKTVTTAQSSQLEGCSLGLFSNYVSLCLELLPLVQASNCFPGLPQYIFGRQGRHSDGHFTGVLPLPPPFSISQSLAKEQVLAALPPMAALFLIAQTLARQQCSKPRLKAKVPSDCNF